MSRWASASGRVRPWRLGACRPPAGRMTRAGRLGLSPARGAVAGRPVAGGLSPGPVAHVAMGPGVWARAALASGRVQAPRRPHDAGRPIRAVDGIGGCRRPDRGGRPWPGAGGPCRDISTGRGSGYVHEMSETCTSPAVIMSAYHEISACTGGGGGHGSCILIACMDGGGGHGSLEDIETVDNRTLDSQGSSVGLVHVGRRRRCVRMTDSPRHGGGVIRGRTTSRRDFRGESPRILVTPGMACQRGRASAASPPAPGIRTWRVGWSGPGRFGGNGPCRRAGRGRRPARAGPGGLGGPAADSSRPSLVRRSERLERSEDRESRSGGNRVAQASGMKMAGRS